MWRVLLLVFCVGEASSWRLPVTCHGNWNVRQELDKLARFTGHDQWDRFTKNWLRQHAKVRTFHIPARERIRSVRILDERRLVVLSDHSRWGLDLDRGVVLFQHKLCKDRSYALGQRLYSTYHDLLAGHHVIECDGKPLHVTEHYPYYVNEGCGGSLATVGLGSEHVLVARLDADGTLWELSRIDTEDVALASAAWGTKIFSGLLNGAIHVHDSSSRSEHVCVLRPLGDMAPTVRSMDAEPVAGGLCVFAGCQDGTVRCCRLSSGTDVLHETWARRFHRGPVAEIRSHSGRWVSAGDDGRVVVSDLIGGRAFYNLSFAGAVGGVDISQRLLAIGHGNALHVWDHGELERHLLPPPRTTRGRGGRGSGGGGISLSL